MTGLSQLQEDLIQFTKLHYKDEKLHLHPDSSYENNIKLLLEMKPTSKRSALHTLLYFYHTLQHLIHLKEQQPNLKQTVCDIEHLQCSIQHSPTLSNSDENKAQLVIQQDVQRLCSSITSEILDCTLAWIVKSLRTKFAPLQLLGAGKTAEVFLGSHHTFKKPFVVLKNVKRPSEIYQDELLQSMVLHEAAIGLALNLYRSILGPAFVYTYGCIVVRNLSIPSDQSYFRTDILTLNQYAQGKTLIEWVNRSKNKTSQRIVDLVHQVFLQVAWTLWKAQEICGFIHFDLHNANVCCRATPVLLPQTWIFEEKGDKIEKTVDKVYCCPIILDLGQAILKNENVWLYNRWKLKESNILQLGNGTHLDPSLPLFDLYRYTTSVLIELASTGNSVLNEACNVLRRRWLGFWRGLKLTDEFQVWIEQIDNPQVSLWSWAKYYKEHLLAYPKMKHVPQFQQSTLFQWMQQIQDS